MALKFRISHVLPQHSQAPLKRTGFWTRDLNLSEW
jgi:hypothetical protein